MKRSPAVTVVVLNFNGLDDTRVCLKSLLKTSYNPLKIIIVDNGSDRDEAKILLKEFPDKRIKFVRFKNNLGFVGGNNKVVADIRSPYIVLLNNDTEVTTTWLEELVKVAQSDKKIAVCQPKIKSFKDRKYFDYSGAAGGYIDRFGYPFTQGRMFNTLEVDNGQYDKVKDIFWSSGAAMLIRRSVIKELGVLFDEIYFNYMEEIDFCWRILNEGKRIVIVPSSVVFHKVASTSKRNLFKKRYFEHRNNLLLLAKNMSSDQFASIVVGRVIMEILTYIYYIFSGQFRYVRSLFLAHIDFLKELPNLKKQKQSRELINPFVYKGSIVVDYYLKGKKTFVELGMIKGSGERGIPGVPYFSPTFYQHKKVYEFCLNKIKNRKVLDMGCGEGYGAFMLSQNAKEVLAVDKDEKSVNTAKENYTRKNLVFKTSDIYELEKYHYFDYSVSLQVIEHVRDTERYLSRISNMLTRDGFAIFSTPNRITQGYNENPYHIKEYSAHELREILLPFFTKVTIYGLHGDKNVILYERGRKEKILKIMSLDKWKLRRYMPISIKILIFEKLIPFVRVSLLHKNPGLTLSINTNNYKITSETEGSMDLIAVCQK